MWSLWWSLRNPRQAVLWMLRPFIVFRTTYGFNRRLYALNRRMAAADAWRFTRKVREMNRGDHPRFNDERR